MINMQMANKIASETVFLTPDIMVLSEYYKSEEIIKNILFTIAASGMSVRQYLYHNNIPVEIIDMLYNTAYLKCNLE